MDFAHLQIFQEGKISTIMINRPQFLNALNQASVEELGFALDKLDGDENVGCIIITGAGEKAFVAGGDISQMKTFSPLEARKFSFFGHSVLRKMELLAKPLIAAINGYCLGGGLELAMACDIRIAAENARFGLPEVKLGVIPGFGGTQRLARLIGEGYAKQMIFTGESIDAERAMNIGLVNTVVADTELMASAKKMANQVAANGPLAVGFAKRALNEGMQVDIDRAMSLEANYFGLSFTTEDQKEGMQAFSSKRAPLFQGK